ncbi:MAG: SDR family oxidoreductase [Chitinophagales bacterium]
MYLIYLMKNANKNIVITGATKGIGRAVAELFAAHQFNLALCARNVADLQSFAKVLHLKYPQIEIFYEKCDVSVKNEVIQFGEFVCQKFPHTDVLVNNAGVFIPGNIHEEADGVLEHIMDTNLYGAYHLSRALIPGMIKNKSGHIFNICSVASINPYDQGGSYAISKFALLGFSKNLRHELKDKYIKVTAILPGATLTPSWEGTQLPDKRFIPAIDVANTIFAAYNTAPSTVIEEIIIRPQLGDI